MPWFKEWFDSPYYHILYKQRDDKEAQDFLDNIVNYLELTDKEKVLDLACGKGRHAIYLNKLGFDVVGIDLSVQNIEEAKKSENQRLRFEVHDMRETFMQNTFDVILNLFTSFGYFSNKEDDLKTLQAIDSGLKRDGIFVLDFFNSRKVIENLVEKEIKTVDGITFHIQRKVENGEVIKCISFEDKGEKFEFFERVRTLDVHDFEKYFRKAGLKLLEIFGDYDLNAFNQIKSDRLILICKKSEI